MTPRTEVKPPWPTTTQYREHATTALAYAPTCENEAHATRFRELGDVILTMINHMAELREARDESDARRHRLTNDNHALDLRVRTLERDLAAAHTRLDQKP